jgi:hypothetical protein
VTGTAWEQQREALQANLSGAQPGTAVPRTPGDGTDREALARALRHPSAGPAPAPPGDSIR